MQRLGATQTITDTPPYYIKFVSLHFASCVIAIHLSLGFVSRGEALNKQTPTTSKLLNQDGTPFTLDSHHKDLKEGKIRLKMHLLRVGRWTCSNTIQFAVVTVSSCIIIGHYRVWTTIYYMIRC